MRIKIEKLDYSEHGASVRVTIDEWLSDEGRTTTTYLTNHAVFVEIDPAVDDVVVRDPAGTS